MKCLVCDSEDFKKTSCGGFRFMKKDFYYFRCQECQFVQIDPVPSDEEIGLLYNNDYYKNYYVRGSKELGYALNRKQALKNAKRFLNYLVKFKKNGLLLDVGCAGGYFILAAKESGFEALGIEQNYSMVKFAAKELHLDVGCSDTLRCFKVEKFDIIHYGDVINNLNNPDSFVADSVRSLKTGGVLAIEGSIAFNPTLAGIILRGVRTFKRNSFDWIADGLPYELWQFNSLNLVRYFQRFNLKILGLKISEDPPRAFSIEKELRGGISAKFICNYILKTLSCMVDNLPFKFSNHKGDRYWLIAQKK